MRSDKEYEKLSSDLSDKYPHAIRVVHFGLPQRPKGTTGSFVWIPFAETGEAEFRFEKATDLRGFRRYFEGEILG